MAKKHKVTTHTQGKELKQPPDSSPKKNNKILKLVAYNSLGAFIIFFFIYTIFQQVPGYNWLYYDMLKGNMKTMEKSKNMTLEQKHTSKLGGEMDLLNNIKNGTPEDAIVIMPSRKMLTDIKATRMQNFAFSYYYTFPRMLVYEDNKENDSLYNKATHILTIGDWGIDRTNATFDSQNPFKVHALKK